MDKYTETLISIDSGNFTKMQLVQIIELTSHKLDIDSISGMAKKEGKSFNGIKKSYKYYKFKIGNIKLAVKGLDDNKLPY